MRCLDLEPDMLSYSVGLKSSQWYQSLNHFCWMLRYQVGGGGLGGRFVGGFVMFFVGFEKVSDFSSLEYQLLDVVVVDSKQVWL